MDPELTVKLDRDIPYWWEFSHIALLLDYVFGKNINTILEGNYCPLLFRSLIFYATNSLQPTSRRFRREVLSPN